MFLNWLKPRPTHVCESHADPGRRSFINANHIKVTSEIHPLSTALLPISARATTVGTITFWRNVISLSFFPRCIVISGEMLFLLSTSCTKETVGTPVCRLCGRYLALPGRPIRVTVPAVTVAPTALVGSLIRSSNLPHSLQRGVHGTF